MSNFIRVGEPAEPGFHLHGGEGREVLRIEKGPRIFVHGEETTDVERIGAAFVEWAREHVVPMLQGPSSGGRE